MGARYQISCVVTFFSYCVFQNLATTKIILIAKEQSSVVYVGIQGPKQNKDHINQQVILETWTNSHVWLHNRSLAHPSFNHTKSLFSHLFTKEFIESF